MNSSSHGIVKGLHGGPWRLNKQYAAVSFHLYNTPGYAIFDVGFRYVRHCNG